MNQIYMELAIKEAMKAYKKDEIPVGAIIVYQNKVIAKAYNKREKTNNVLAHAEILAIQKAAKRLQSWKLNDCDLYVTLKPCSMCEKVITESRISHVYYLADKLNYKKEYCKTSFELCTDFEKSLQTEYLAKFKEFFDNKR